MPYRDIVVSAYHNHRIRAKRRGIPFLLTYEEWCVIWMESGKWEERGHNRGQYCMARFGDKGGYEVGNVRICTVEENAAERNRNFKITGIRHKWHGKNMWLEFSEESKAKHRLARRRRSISQELN